MNRQPLISGYISTHCGKSWHRHFCVVWPKRDDAEAKLQFFSDELSFQRMVNEGKFYSLHDVNDCYVDEFLRVGIHPGEKKTHVLELYRPTHTENQGNVLLKLPADCKWAAWLEILYRIICEYKESDVVAEVDCGNSATKPGKGSTKYGVSMCESTLTSGLGVAGKAGSLYVLPTSLLLKLDKTGRTVQWPFTTIRRFKAVGGILTIEVGRKATTGPGIVRFLSRKSNELLHQLAKATDAFQKRSSLTMKPTMSENIYSQGPGDSKESTSAVYELLTSRAVESTHYATISSCT